jgi:hypothetical protein
MTHLTSHVIAKLIADAGFGKMASDPTLTADDWLVTYETQPDAKDYPRAITTAAAEGFREDKRDMRRGTPTIFPGVSVMVRGYDDAEVAVKADAVCANLDSITLCRRVTVGESVYRVQNFQRAYDPTFLMEEDRDARRVWVFRGAVTVTQEV